MNSTQGHRLINTRACVTMSKGMVCVNPFVILVEHSICWLMHLHFICFDIPDPCTLPRDPGRCSGTPKRMYYYDQSSGLCEQFYYSGCHGNPNRFGDLESCQLACNVVGVEESSVVLPEGKFAFWYTHTDLSDQQYRFHIRRYPVAIASWSTFESTLRVSCSYYDMGNCPRRGCGIPTCSSHHGQSVTVLYQTYIASQKESGFVSGIGLDCIMKIPGN